MDFLISNSENQQQLKKEELRDRLAIGRSHPGRAWKDGVMHTSSVTDDTHAGRPWHT